MRSKKLKMEKKEEVERHLMESVYRLKWIIMFAIFAMPLVAFNVGVKWESTVADHAETSYLIMTFFMIIWGVLLYFINEGLAAIIQRAEMYLDFSHRYESMLNHSIANSKEMLEYIKKLEATIEEDDDEDEEEEKKTDTKAEINTPSDPEAKK